MIGFHEKSTIIFNHIRLYEYNLRNFSLYKFHISCLKGKVFDVAVDIRKKSSTYGKWVGEILSDENKYQLYIPAGFAHGYYVMSEVADIAYKCSEIYHPEDELGLRWNDPDIAIEWPVLNPILSNKDAILPFLADNFQ